MKSLQSHAKRFNLLKVGTRDWNTERVLLEGLEKKGMLPEPINVKKYAFLNQFGYTETFIHRIYRVGRYEFKLIEYYTDYA